MGNQKSKLKETIKQLFALAQIKFLDVPLQDGTSIRTEDEMIDKGSQVMLVTADGTTSAVADGDYITADGTKLTIKSGVVEECMPADPSATPAGGEATDAASASDSDKNAVALDIENKGTMEMDENMGQVLDVLKQLIERISNIEKKLSETTKSQAAMSKEFSKQLSTPGAKPIHKETPKEEITDAKAWARKEIAQVNAKFSSNNGGNTLTEAANLFEKQLAKKNANLKFSTSDEEVAMPKTGGNSMLANDPSFTRISSTNGFSISN